MGNGGGRKCRSGEWCPAHRAAAVDDEAERVGVLRPRPMSQLVVLQHARNPVRHERIDARIDVDLGHRFGVTSRHHPSDPAAHRSDAGSNINKDSSSKRACERAQGRVGRSDEVREHRERLVRITCKFSRKGFLVQHPDFG